MKTPSKLYSVIPASEIRNYAKGYTFFTHTPKSRLVTYQDEKEARKGIKKGDVLLSIDAGALGDKVIPLEGGQWSIPSLTRYQIVKTLGDRVAVQALPYTPPSTRVLPKTDNDQLFDAKLRHHMGLLIYAKTLADQAKATMQKTEKQIKELIYEYFPDFTGIESKKDRDLLEGTASNPTKGLIPEALAIRANAWNEINLSGKIEEIIPDEQQSYLDLLATVSPFAIGAILKSLSNKMLLRAFQVQKVDGFTFRDWERRIKEDDLRRLDNALRFAAYSTTTPTGTAPPSGIEPPNPPPSTKTLLDAVFGTKELDYKDSPLQQANNALDTFSVTGITLASSVITDAINQTNAFLFDKEVFVAVLDEKTSKRCRALDGTVFEIGKGIHPPLHPHCRSLRIPFFQYQKDLKIKKERNAEYQKEYDALQDPSQDYETWLKNRLIRGIGGQPAVVDFSEFMKSQSRSYQEKVLGKTAAKLFNDGGLPLEKFVTPDGLFYTLRELAVIQQDSFIQAGLNPEKYITKGK